VPATAGGVRLAYVAPPASSSQSRGVPEGGIVVLFRTCATVIRNSRGILAWEPGGACGRDKHIRGLLSSTFRLNVSTFCGDIWCIQYRKRLRLS